ncbi:MAG: endonuclease MutS2, partial [Gemmatimonadaceae bacterium]
DALYGRARYAVATGCADATLVAARDGFHVREGRHPLLLAQGIAVVPFELAMGPEERTLLVSGPNTGGKTVLLKALALCALMMQCGIPAPVGPESVLPAFDDVFADIGDEQSLAASLSTFSAHLKHLTQIVHSASPDALVLIDELGSGTDPLEGAALGGAILEALTTRGVTTIATTHLGALKELAGEVPGVVNASLQFDAERLAPTYRLIKGIPGRSYGLAIARRLQMPEAVLARAEARVPTMERDLAALLTDLESRSARLAAQEEEVRVQSLDLQRRAARIAERERAVQGREREVERESRREARRHLLDARKAVEQTIASLRAAGAAAIDGVAVEARRTLEGRAAAEQSALEALDAEERVAQQAAARERAAAEGEEVADARGVTLAIGDAVAVETLGGKARYGGSNGVALRRRRSATHLRSERVEIAALDLPEVEAKPEVDVRGVRVHEVDDLVLQAVDGAIRADLAQGRSIHGKGTGALRERGAQVLKGDRRVKQFRLGAWNEGGAGVTIAEFA